MARAARIALLSFLLLAGLGAAIVAPPFGRIGDIASLVVLAIVSFVFLRHAGLAALAVLSPLPGLFLFQLAIRPMVGTHLPDIALPGFVLACWLLSGFAAGTAQGRALKMPWLTVLGVSALVLAFQSLTLAQDGHSYLPSVLGFTAATVTSVVIVVWLGAPALPYGEDFVARTNRLRESRERLFARLAPLATPRWGWSLAGIAVVFAVLGYFASPPQWRDVTIWSAPGAVLLAVALVLLRDWRRALATLLALFPVWLLLHGIAGSGAVMAMAVGAIGLYILPADAARDDPAAFPRALERDGALIVFTTLGAALAFLPFLVPDGALAVLVCGFAALVLPGAFMAVIDSAFPSREAVEARYRVG